MTREMKNRTMKLVQYISIIWMLLPGATLPAQNEDTAKEYDLNLIYYNHGDSVSLFWVPSGYENFRRGADKGYVLERRKKGSGEWTALFTLKPVSNADWDMLSRRIEGAAVMQELIYMNEKKTGAVPEDDEPEPVSESYSELEDSDDGDGDSEEEMMYNFSLITALTNAEIARAAALLYVDRTTQKNTVYEYRVVFAESKTTDNLPAITVDMTQLSTLPKPADFHGDFSKKDVMFQWDVKKLSDIYASYRIERSLDGKKFTQVNEEPIIYSYSDDEFENTVVFKDVLADRKTVHYYRMSGYSPFGIYGPPSDVVKGKGTPDFDVQITIDTIAVNEKNEAIIRWSVNPDETRLIKGFLIDKARTPEHEFQPVEKKLLPAKRREYIDKTTERTAYYRVHAIGFNENEVATSFPYFAFQQDTIPPAPPAGLKGTIDSLGVVVLTWEPNREEDIYAYRVFRSNDNSTDDYISVADTFLLTPFYTDTLPLNTLTNEIFFKVAALDKNYNPSPMSEAVRLVKPDTIPPVKSLILKVHQPADDMEIVWENSSSLDVEKIVLLRQVSDTGQVVKVMEWSKLPEKSIYTDTGRFPGEQVRYLLQTYDYSGNMSEDISFWEKAKGSLPSCVNKLQVTPKHDKALVELTWEQGNCAIEKVHIYRQVNNGKTLLLTTLGGAQRVFEDKKVKSGETYKYILRAVGDRFSPAIYSDEVNF